MGWHLEDVESSATGRNLLVAGTDEATLNPTTADRGLVITYGEGGADGWVSSNQATKDALPDALTLVSVGDSFRSTATSSGNNRELTELPDADTYPIVMTVAEPTDFSSLDFAITNYLTNGGEIPSGCPKTVVVFDSLDALFDRVLLHDGFRFLHILTSLVETSGAIAYYRLDPSRVDRGLLETIRVLFDVELGVSG